MRHSTALVSAIAAVCAGRTRGRLRTAARTSRKQHQIAFGLAWGELAVPDGNHARAL